MRIKSDSDLSGFGSHARKQIEKALQSKPAKSNALLKRSGRDSAFADGLFKRQKPAKVMKTHENYSYCPYPSPDPGVALHIAMLDEFGSWWDGGELVDEMILPGHKIRFRFDLCLPRYKFAIEVDGFGYHRDLVSFKRDREKQKHALLHGWVVHRLTNSDLREGFDQLVPDIKVMLAHRERSKATIKKVGNTWCELIQLKNQG